MLFFRSEDESVDKERRDTCAKVFVSEAKQKDIKKRPGIFVTGEVPASKLVQNRGGICPFVRHCQRQCKFFASGVYFSIFTHFLCFFLLKLLKLGEIDGVKFLA